jgi:diaminopimelate decarboxylase
MILGELIPPRLLGLDDALARMAEKYGTPLYIYDRHTVTEDFHHLREMLPQDVEIYYALKANPLPQMVVHIAGLGCGCEVSSESELAVARQAVEPDRILVTGPAKTDALLRRGATLKVGAVIIESRREADRLSAISAGLGVRTRALLRVNPGRAGHAQLSMGGSTPFGMEPDQAVDLLATRGDWPGLDLFGLHGYAASNITDPVALSSEFANFLDLFADIRNRSGCPLHMVDLGGGFGVASQLKDRDIDWSGVKGALADGIRTFRRGADIAVRVAVESGRFLVARGGVLLARVVDVKRTYGKVFAVLDGGTNVYLQPSKSYGKRPNPTRVIGRAGPVVRLSICGPLCTPADVMVAEADFPLPEIGALVAFYLTGAYGATASPGRFLGHGFPYEAVL